MSTTTTTDNLNRDQVASTPDSLAREPRFEFGKNWSKFLQLLDDDRIDMARKSLQSMLGLDDLAEKSFLDAGSGSGLFSLAAAQLGAKSIVSFDYDPHSVACTCELKRRYFPDRDDWTIDRGDCLDNEMISRLPKFDVVYSWGVLHHTGNLWQAMENIVSRVAPGGQFFTSIYNDQRWQSRIWTKVKRTYCRGPIRRASVCAVGFPLLFSIGLVSDVVNGRNPVHRYSRHHARGMSTFRDWFDWLGGYPFEVARPEEVLEFCRDRGFVLEKLRTVGGGWGCNEFVFRRVQ